MRVLLRWAIVSFAILAAIVIAGFANILVEILIDDYIVYALALGAGLVGLTILVIAVSCCPAGLEWIDGLSEQTNAFRVMKTSLTFMYKFAHVSAVTVGSGLLLVASLMAFGEAATDLLIWHGLKDLQGQERDAGKRALYNAQSACGSEPGDAILRHKFRLVELKVTGPPAASGIPACQAKIRTYTLFMIPTGTVYAQCDGSSVGCYGPPPSGT